MIGTLVILAVIFTQLSLLAFGGGVSVLPEIHRQVVDVYHWMNAEQFSSLYALAQAAPGPNLMIVPLVGWHVAGLPGLLVASAAKFAPSSIMTCMVLSVWNRFKDRPWRRVVQAGLVPITAGVVTASAAVITMAIEFTWPLATFILLSSTLLSATRVHPLVVLGTGALFGVIGWI